MKESGLVAMTMILSVAAVLPARAVGEPSDFAEFLRNANQERILEERVDSLNPLALDPRCMVLDVADGVIGAVDSDTDLHTCSEVIVAPRSGWRNPRSDDTCQTGEHRDTSLGIITGVQRYKPHWPGTPNWIRGNIQTSNCDSGTVHYVSTADIDGSGWTSFGYISFEGRVSHESIFDKFKAGSISAIGLLPLNDDAVCDRVTATFRDGSTKELPLVNGSFLSENWITTLNVPARSTPRLLALSRRAEHGGHVSIEIRGAG